VDDEVDFCEFVRKVGEMNDYEVTTLNDATLFKETYRKIEPHRIVLDIVMPGLDGISLIDWLASTGNQAGVVIVTGYNPNLADAAKVFAKIKGRFFVTTLTKPVTVATLSGALSAS
jgi:FixJ family two-component response regulator